MRPAATRLHVFLLWILITLPGVASAQSLFVYDVDPSGFPTITAGLSASDENGVPVPIGASDFEVLDNGEPAEGVVIECPTVTEELAFSAVLINDRSGSMMWSTRSGRRRIDLLKSGVKEFLAGIPFIPPTAIALTAFDSDAFILSDFQTSAAPLITAIDALQPDGGTEYNPPFLDRFVGAIAMLDARSDKHRRVAIFLTDGQSNTSPNISQIINRAVAAKVEVYTITIGMPMTPDLELIAAATGGASFGDVSTEDQIREIYRLIAIRSRGLLKCRISWRAKPDCGSDNKPHTVTIRLKSRNLATTFEYTPPPGNTIGLTTAPEFLWYGSPAPPASVDRSLNITARGAPVTVTGAFVTPAAPFTVTDWGGTPPPFTLDVGQSRTLRVRFTPSQVSFSSAVLNIELGTCPPQPVTLTGGAEPAGFETPLVLLRPLGGENFSSCDSVDIRWGGVAPDRPVRIEYSADDGKIWKVITDTARNLGYRWKPPLPGRRYRIRISVDAGEPGIISKIAGGGSGIDGSPASNAILSGPSGVARRGDSIFLAESADNRVRVIDLKTGLISTLPIPNLSNPHDVLVSGNILFVTDREKHRIMSFDLRTNRPSLIAGDGQPMFKGDGGPGQLASIYWPSFLALRGTMLYFTEEGNDVIRRIDLASTRHTVTTLAGRGSSTAEDILAKDARLFNPTGIAIHNDTLYFSEPQMHRIRRIDLRTGSIRTVYGNGTRGFSGDGGQAISAQFDQPIGLSVIGNRLVISDAGNRRIRWVDIRTGIISTIAGTGIEGFSGDGEPAIDARLTRPAQTEVYRSILYLPDLWSNRLRAVAIPSPAADSSTSSFSVTAPAMEIAATRPLDLGSVAVGAAGDSLFGALVCNRGDAPMVLDSVVFTGANALDFSIVSGVDANPILPGECREIEIRFRPTAMGRRTAIAVAHARCTDTASFGVVGNGQEPCGLAPHPTIDLGTVVPGSSGTDSLITQSLCNNGSRTLAGNVTLSPDGGSFVIVAGAGPFSVAPGECLQVTVRFTPVGFGRVNSAIDYGLPAGCGTGRTLLVGRGTRDAELAIPDLRFRSQICASDAVDSALHIGNSGGVDMVITDLKITTNLEGFSIPSLPSFPLTIPAGTIDSTSVRIRFAPVTPGEKSGTLSITSNATSTPYEMKLAGRRESAAVDALPNGVLFRDYPGATVPRDTTITLRNSGTLPMTIEGGKIGGVDASRFELPAGQFPITLPTGGTTSITVRSLAPAANGFFSAQLRLGVTPRCGDSLELTMAQGNNPPMARSNPMVLSTLYCGHPESADSVLTIVNDGGSDLVIDNHVIEGDIDGAFSVVFGPMPAVISARGSLAVPVSFAPRTAGAHSARLVLRTNMPDREYRIDLSGRYETTTISSTISLVRFLRVPANQPYDTTIDVRNDGTTPVTLSLPVTAGLFELEMVGAPEIDPGSTGRVRIRFIGAPAGSYNGSTTLVDSRCSSGLALALEATVGDALMTTVSLPVDSALPGTIARLPVRLAINDPARFAETGARGYTAEISFFGTMLVLDTVTHGRIVAQSYDRNTRIQRLTIAGEYDPSMNDTLTSILCSVVLGASTISPLTFESFVWDVASVPVDTINGSFSTHGSCFDAGIRLVMAPRVLKVVPQPMQTSGVVEIELDEWATLSILLVDDRGATVASVASGYFTAGRHSVTLSPVDLPSGAYTLVARTPFGEAATRVMIVR